MISRFFKKKETPAPSKKIAKVEKIKVKATHKKVLTAEGWHRMMSTKQKPKK